jgi:N-acetylglucosaminyldiphosphoundecaprenol N-acetyl-beta-D-mannosaminyltransferase
MNRLRGRIEAGVTVADVVRPGESTSFVNPFSYLKLRLRPDLLDAIDHWGVDGMSLQILLRIWWRSGVRRASLDYTSLAAPVFEALSEQGRTIFVIGSEQALVDAFVEHLHVEFPRLLVIGHRDGFFESPAQRAAVAGAIAAQKPDFVLVGMGAVLQEDFILALRAAGFDGAAATCGGFIHQTARAGRRYYPAWVDRLNLRFAYRMFDEPALVHRYLVDYPRAFVTILNDLRAGPKVAREAGVDADRVDTDKGKLQ